MLRTAGQRQGPCRTPCGSHRTPTSSSRLGWRCPKAKTHGRSTWRTPKNGQSEGSLTQFNQPRMEEMSYRSGIVTSRLEDCDYDLLWVAESMWLHRDHRNCEDPLLLPHSYSIVHKDCTAKSCRMTLFGSKQLQFPMGYLIAGQVSRFSLDHFDFFGT